MKKIKFVRYDNRLHFDFLFKYFSDPDETCMFIRRVPVNSVRRFEAWLEKELEQFYHEFFMLETNGELIGFAYSYDETIEDQHCKIGVYIIPEWRIGGLGAIAGIYLMDYLFNNYPFRRIHCDVYEYNSRSLESLLQCGFEKMGILKEYRYFRNTFYDLVLLSMTRETFYNNNFGILKV